MAVAEGYMLPADAGFEAAAMPGLRKAAILIMAVGEELAKTLFQSLNEVDVQKVTEEITRLGEVPAAQLTKVLTEFYGLLETQQYMVRGGPEYAAKLLTEAFGKERADELLTQVHKLRERTTGDLAVLQKMEPQQLSKFLENENPQTVALVLAHIGCRPRVYDADVSEPAAAGGGSTAVGGDASCEPRDGAEGGTGAASAAGCAGCERAAELCGV